MVIFLAQAIVVSLSGVLAPGPMTAATLAGGARNRHAGALIAIGHGIVEFPLMVLIVVGADAVLAGRGFRIGVGLAGGLALLLMAWKMLSSLRHKADQAAPAKSVNPIWAGVILTGGNPYFLLWWATVGLALATKAIGLGVTAFVLFTVIHWLCDLIWLEFLSLAAHKGASVFGPRSQPAILAVCAAAMCVFGAMFIWDAVKGMAG